MNKSEDVYIYEITALPDTWSATEKANWLIKKYPHIKFLEAIELVAKCHLKVAMISENFL